MKKALSFLLLFLGFPVSVLLGVLVPGGRGWMVGTALAACLTLFLFALGIEKKNIGTRRQVACAVLIALSCAGRFIPFFKPVTALTVIGAIWLGKESGFLIGSLSALVSGIWFGLGPWTPFQMLGWGLIGFIAALFAEKLKKSRLLLCLYGAAGGIFFSLLMDVWSAAGLSGGDGRTYSALVLSSIPFALLYAASNVFFLWVLARPIGEKLERVKKKYGI